ncbi:hypothetical protein GCM10010411_75240 [Actinomadura fulvescens]|uniref:Uncharacterized protein n=2 Tax=Actinomadura fulvescens TaxID=46160 RepID=A0ABN3QI58_9ACTN
MNERLAVEKLLEGEQTPEDELAVQLAQVQQDRVRDWADAEWLGWTSGELDRLVFLDTMVMSEVCESLQVTGSGSRVQRRGQHE